MVPPPRKLNGNNPDANPAEGAGANPGDNGGRHLDGRPDGNQPGDQGATLGSPPGRPPGEHPRDHPGDHSGQAQAGKDPRVDALLQRETRWRDEFSRLRSILLDLPLEETVKWGQPCYTHGGKNVVLIHGFKDYCALLFFKGALLDDPHGVLVRQTEAVRATRQMRFTSLAEIEAKEPVIREYVGRAIAVEEAGLRVDFAEGRDLPVPGELEEKLAAMPELKAAWEALTPGRRRAYILYFTRAKQPATRLNRIERSIPRILEGKGLND